MIGIRFTPELPHAKLPCSELGSFESDLRDRWKNEFFEVPNIMLLRQHL